jgi:hypothetical protein
MDAKTAAEVTKRMHELYVVHKVRDLGSVMVSLKDDRYLPVSTLLVATANSGMVDVSVVSKYRADLICRDYPGTESSTLAEFLLHQEVISVDNPEEILKILG